MCSLQKPAPFLTTSARRVRVKRIQIDKMGRNTLCSEPHERALMASKAKTQNMARL